MSPNELAGKSIGRVPDGRNVFCPKCRRSFRGFKLEAWDHKENVTLIFIKCPYKSCGYVKRANRKDLIFVKEDQIALESDKKNSQARK